MERRTLPGERPGVAAAEVAEVLGRLGADPAFKAASRAMFSRSPYEIAADHPLVAAVQAAFQSVAPVSPVLSGAPPAPPPAAPVRGMSFWTDASVLGDAGIPALLFGPTGAGLHSVEEWVDVRSVLVCRDVLVDLVRRWCR
jgi:acetylornithine deacetylase